MGRTGCKMWRLDSSAAFEALGSHMNRLCVYQFEGVDLEIRSGSRLTGDLHTSTLSTEMLDLCFITLASRSLYVAQKEEFEGGCRQGLASSGSHGKDARCYPLALGWPGRVERGFRTGRETSFFGWCWGLQYGLGYR
jgi:hypothetical protein